MNVARRTRRLYHTRNIGTPKSLRSCTQTFWLYTFPVYCSVRGNGEQRRPSSWNGERGMGRSGVFEDRERRWEAIEV
jgi:hypothetical protein